ncbi:PhoH family protein [Egicoccus sp. AB-alg6-2]|uniref:PhoH family protein n=1 Tax=Egicoccus sp. AB-alg6-2 TaxID=3242692 RepID=UPI00359EAED0
MSSTPSPLGDHRTAAVPADSVKVLVPGEHAMVSLLGTNDELLKLIENAFSAEIHVRGNEITIHASDPTETARVSRMFEELVLLLGRGQLLDKALVRQTIRMIRADEGERPSDVLSEALITHRGRTIRPKTLGQKRYLDAIKASTVTFGIGPAGTGKTYLAMGAAVQALRAKQVNRLILTRPAVEAGERLGFLPGTLHEKIDPYLKPLWDALHDMMEAEELINHVDRGTIEVAPLAYMRGRAQPVSERVLTPRGWRPIGDLDVGDEVVGSNGRPTTVLGTFPQGEQDIFRLTTRDGASTRCTADHLWAVATRTDRWRDRAPRVLETRELVDRLGRGRHRDALPLLRAPVEFARRDVPMDPYAFGLLVGGQAAMSAPEPAAVGGGAPRLPDEVRHAVATGSVAEVYRFNAADVRLATLQGLLDGDGGRVERCGRSCRIRYTADTAPLADDVRFLVGSLGGVAHPRPGGEATILEIRLPAGVEPFRDAGKRAAYTAARGVAPARFIEAIEPDGVEDAVCIRVAASDSLYVTEDLILTHNTLNDAFIVLDEAQNTTAEQMKMFLTRIGFNSKAVVTGDVSQVDLPSGKRSGLRIVGEILDGIEGVSFAHLRAGDVVRHHIVQRIVEAYAEWDQAQEEAEEARKRDRDANRRED